MTNFADLNVVYTNKDNLLSILKKCVVVKLSRIAVSLAVTLTDNEKAGVAQLTSLHEKFIAEIVELRRKVPQIKIFTRLTITVSNKSRLTKFASNFLAKLRPRFDLLAIVPKSQECFVHICNEFKNYDIVSFDVEDFEAKTFRLAHHLKTLANEKIMIELNYSDFFFVDEAALDSMKKLALAKDLFRRAKVKNYVLSSGASTPDHLRGAADIINLSYLLGWKPAQIRHFLQENSRLCLNRATTRERTAGGYFSVLEIFREGDLSNHVKNVLRHHINQVSSAVQEERKRRR